MKITKKHSPRRLLCLLAAISLLLSAAAAASLGTQKGGSSVQISSGATLSDGVWYSEGTLQSENYIEYTPGSSTLPVVAYGSKLYGTSTYESVCSYLGSQGASVVAAINGDFFNTTSGLPNGIVVTDGIVRGSDGYQYAVGFRPDGTAIIGRPEMNMNVRLPSGTLSLFAINRALSSAGVFLYTPDYSATTRSNASALYVTIRPSGSLRLSGSVTASVVSSQSASSPVSIPDGCMILAVTADNSNYSTLSSLTVGASVTINIGSAPGWSDVTYAVGANQLLVKNGTAVSGLTSQTAPRTAIGIKPDGKIVFYTVDGRQPGLSTGIGLNTLAARMIEFGCVTAVNLDGGGSTAMGIVYPGKTDLQTVNSPSEGSLRKCANFVFLVNTAPSSGIASALHLYPHSQNVLAGATVSFQTTATDSGWHAAPVPGSPSFSASIGDITQSGVWTAPDSDGTCTVTAGAQGLSASATLKVIASPDTVDILKDHKSVSGKSLTLATGSTTDFSAAAIDDSLRLFSQDTQYTWSVTGGIGTVDSSGIFTAANLEAGGSGTLVASCGSSSASVKITITGSAIVLEDFEGLNSLDVAGTGASLSLCSEHVNVKYRYHSACLAYSDNEGMDVLRADVPYSLTLAGGFTYLCLWIKGDGSANTLCATLPGAESPLKLTTLQSKDWKFVSTAIPSGATAISGFSILCPEGASLTSGTVYLDMIYQSKSNAADTRAPTISFTQGGLLSTAVVLDNGNGIPTANLRVTLDGKDLTFTYDPASGLLTPAIPALSAGEHLLSITASDAYGNACTEFISLDGGSTIDPFIDTDGHWARKYITYLNSQGVVTGSVVDGSYHFRPDAKITRAEFSAILSRWLGVDTSKYAAVKLPFKDTADIPAWALGHVRAMYSLGIVSGSLENGQLRFNAQANITRAQAMAMLGRTQPMGYESAPLDFTDAGSIPSWAVPFISTLVARGVINGSGGFINPDGNASRAEVAKMIYAMG